MSHLRTPLFILILILVLVGCAPQAAAPTEQPTAEPTVEQVAEQAADPVRILRLDSYHAEFPWSAEITRGVLQALSEHGYEVDGETIIFDEFFMDTKRNTSEEYFAQIGADTIAYIEETQPDVVIASDDNAAGMVVQKMRQGDIPFIILGLNGTPENYEFDAEANVTSVLERPHMAEMMDWITQVFGEDARLAIMAEDSATSDRMFGDGSIEATVNDSDVELVSITRTNDYEDWQEMVQNAKDTSDVLFLGAYATLRTDADEAIEPLAALEWTLKNSEIPVMGFWEEAVHTGTLGGSVISGYVQGYEAGLRATMILDGTPANEIPHSAPSRGKLIINKHAMEQWDVNIPLDLLEVSEIVES